jgi:hypothetical protein
LSSRRLLTIGLLLIAGSTVFYNARVLNQYFNGSGPRSADQ